jgi:hypothetical protein
MVADFTIRPRRRPRWDGSTIVVRCRAWVASFAERELGEGDDLAGGVVAGCRRVGAVAAAQFGRLLAAYPVRVVRRLLDRQVAGGSVEHEPALQWGDILDDLFRGGVAPLHQRLSVRVGPCFGERRVVDPRMIGDLAPGPDVGHAGLMCAVGEVAVTGLVAGHAAGQCPDLILAAPRNDRLASGDEASRSDQRVSGAQGGLNPLARHLLLLVKELGVDPQQDVDAVPGPGSHSGRFHTTREPGRHGSVP